MSGIHREEGKNGRNELHCPARKDVLCVALRDWDIAPWELISDKNQGKMNTCIEEAPVFYYLIASLKILACQFTEITYAIHTENVINKN